MEIILIPLKNIAVLSAFVLVLVFLAIFADFMSGWRKAKIAKQAHTSIALRRTITKIITYEGSVLIGICIDCMLQISKLFEIECISQFKGVPLFTIVIGIYLCFTEFLSIRENADKKTQKRMNETNEMIKEIVKTTAKNAKNIDLTKLDSLIKTLQLLNNPETQSEKTDESETND